MEQKDSLADLRILSLDEAATLGGFSVSHLRRLAADGSLKIRKIGKRRVGITVPDYREFLDSLGLVFSTRKPAADANNS